MSQFFSHAQVFWFGPILFLTLLVCGRGRWRRRRELTCLAREAALPKLLRARPRTRRFVHGAVWLGLVSLWLGAAGPRWGRDANSPTKSGQDVVVVLDVSRSMFAEQPSRLERALRALEDLAASMQKTGGHRLGLVLFAARPHLAFPLTHDYDHFRFVLSQVRDGVIPAETRADSERAPASGTRIGAALALACEMGAETTPLSVLLLSDGDDPAQDREWLEGIATARARKARVHVVGIGDPQEAHLIPHAGDYLKHQDQPVRTRLEEAPLQEIARATGGVYIPAHDAAVPLGSIFGDILRSRPTGAADNLSSVPMLQQRFAWFFWPALVLLSGSLMLRTHPDHADVFKGMQRWWPRGKGVALAAVSLMLVSANPQNLVRQANAAFTRGDFEQALKLYEQAETTTEDPGLVAYNKGVAYDRLQQPAQAESHFRRCLDDDRVPTLRKAQAFFGLGNALLLQAGDKNAGLLDQAIEAFENCLSLNELPQDRRDDVRYNLELAKLLRLKATPSPDPKDPGSAPKTPSKPDVQPKEGTDKNGKKTNVGDPVKTKEAGGVDPKAKGGKAHAGLLQVLDRPELVPLAPEATAGLLDGLAERLRRERQQHLRQTAPNLPQVKDW